MNDHPSHGEWITASQAVILRYKHQLTEQDLSFGDLLWMFGVALLTSTASKCLCCLQQNRGGEKAALNLGKEGSSSAPYCGAEQPYSLCSQRQVSWQQTHNLSKAADRRGDKNSSSTKKQALECSYNLKPELHQLKQLSFTDSFMAELCWWSLILWKESSVP